MARKRSARAKRARASTKARTTAQPRSTARAKAKENLARVVVDQWIEKFAILELCARYCLTIDAQDADGWADCFSPDGVFEVDGSAVRGRAALREYAAVHHRVMRCRHMTVNHLYDVRGDRASGRSTTVVTLATPGGYKIFGQGMYEDELVKLNGIWRIESRRVRTDRLVDDPEKPINLADPDVAALVRHLVAAAAELSHGDRP